MVQFWSANGTEFGLTEQAEFGLIFGMSPNLLDSVLSNLRRRDRPWVEVAKASGVPYDTLKKIANGVTPNPGVRHVQALADYFAGEEQPNSSATPHDQHGAQAAQQGAA